MTKELNEDSQYLLVEKIKILLKQAEKRLSVEDELKSYLKVESFKDLVLSIHNKELKSLNEIAMRL